MHLIHVILVGMEQSSLDVNLSTKKPRKQKLLAQMDRVEFSGLHWSNSLPVLPGRQEWPSALCTGNHVAYPLHAAVVHPVRSGDGRSFLDTLVYREFAGLDAHG